MKKYMFYKSGRQWYIDLPEYLQQGGAQDDLEMVDGADKLLDLISGQQDAVSLTISEEQFDGADLLELREVCDPYLGGAVYFLKYYEGQEVNREIWLCQVTAFVFGDLPDKIFIRKAV